MGIDYYKILQVDQNAKDDDLKKSYWKLAMKWSAAPCHRFYLEVLKDGSIIDQFQVNDKGAYMFGCVNLCDFVLDHPHPTFSSDMTTIAEARRGEVSSLSYLIWVSSDSFSLWSDLGFKVQFLVKTEKPRKIVSLLNK